MAAALAIAWGPAWSQSQGMSGLFAEGDSLPIEVTADNGIEWRQEERTFVASGNAVAVRGDVEVRSRLLRAHYRETADGRTEIWRLDAEGEVVISAPDQMASGTLGVFDVDNAVFVLSGDDVRYVTPDTDIRADRQLEYWQNKNMAVARGNARSTRDGSTLRADVLAAYFAPDAAGNTGVSRLEAFDNVSIVTSDETVSSRRAVYDVNTSVAVLTGAVKITRGENQLNGCRAEVNVDSGVSRLSACGPDSGGGRVRGLISVQDPANPSATTGDTP